MNYFGSPIGAETGKEFIWIDGERGQKGFTVPLREFANGNGMEQLGCRKKRGIRITLLCGFNH